MPGLDGTGPEGRGRRTGRGLGYCRPQPNRSETENNMDESTPGFRRRPGSGGRGRGRMNRFKSTGKPGWMRRRP